MDRVFKWRWTGELHGRVQVLEVGTQIPNIGMQLVGGVGPWQVERGELLTNHFEQCPKGCLEFVSARALGGVLDTNVAKAREPPVLDSKMVFGDPRQWKGDKKGLDGLRVESLFLGASPVPSAETVTKMREVVGNKANVLAKRTM